MNKDLKAIIISTMLITAGIGIMGMSDNHKTVNTIGGGLFLVGLIMLSMSLYNVVKK